jgi:1,5-anhydro-D-fructose reductase (1,5-anhydro-D-mannitol-forming)
MALRYEEDSSMQQAAVESRRILGIAFYRRTYPKVERARELIASGAIGRPVFAEATAHDWFHPADGFRGWLVDPQKAGGGPLYDIGSHRIDLLNYFFGAPARVAGQASTLVQPTAVEDNASVLIEYESGVRALVDVRWHSRVVRDEFRIRGTEGELELSPLNAPELVYPGGVERLAAHANLHYPCVEDFAGAVAEGRAPRSSGLTALASQWVIGQVNSPIANAAP